MKICWLFPLFVKICLKNVQSSMTSLCSNLILLFEFYGYYSYGFEEFIVVGGTMRSYRLEENVQTLINQNYDIWLYKSQNI